MYPLALDNLIYEKIMLSNVKGNIMDFKKKFETLS